MPIYDWLDKKSQKQVAVLRHFSEYEKGPTKEEAVAEGFTEQEFTDAKWERLIGAAIQVHRAWGWGGGKGSWILLLGFLASYSLLSSLGLGLPVIIC